jgi:molecular chaperone GrpE
MSHNPFADDDVTEAPESGEPGATGHHSVEADVERQLVALQEERDTLYERLARATADFQNTRRRLQAEHAQQAQYATGGLIKGLLPVIDSFERALAVDPSKADAAGILKGMQIVHDQLLNVLKGNHVETIEPEPGTPFDPNQHEAMMQQGGEEYADPTVTQLLQKGYALHGRVLRPAQVAVSKTE